MSPSSRRAWIEIAFGSAPLPGFLVALLAEGVDRNIFVVVGEQRVVGRPPRGGRG